MIYNKITNTVSISIYDKNKNCTTLNDSIYKFSMGFKDKQIKIHTPVYQDTNKMLPQHIPHLCVTATLTEGYSKPVYSKNVFDDLFLICTKIEQNLKTSEQVYTYEQR
jgi:hypothetical protein